MNIKFPITRKRAAKLLKRPYSTIRCWTKKRLLTSVDFELLETWSNNAVRRRSKIKPVTSKKVKPVQYYYVPILMNGIVNRAELERLIKNDAIKDNTHFYVLGKKMKATKNIALKEVR